MSDIHVLVGAYAVDAVDDIERRLFERHLATCAECRDEVASLKETGSLLSSTSATSPPSSLRDRLMEDIATVRPLPPEVPVRQDAERSGVSKRRWFPSLVAAAAAVAVIGGGGALVATQPWQDGTSQQATATDQVLQARDARAVTVDFEGGAKAKLVRSESHGQAVLVTNDMPTAPVGMVYQLWLQSPEGEMLPAGLMAGGNDSEVLLDGDAGTAKAAGITVEPAGGSPAPTSDPIALFDFAKAV